MAGPTLTIGDQGTFDYATTYMTSPFVTEKGQQRIVKFKLSELLTRWATVNGYPYIKGGTGIILDLPLNFLIDTSFAPVVSISNLPNKRENNVPITVTDLKNSFDLLMYSLDNANGPSTNFVHTYASRMNYLYEHIIDFLTTRSVIYPDFFGVNDYSFPMAKLTTLNTLLGFPCLVLRTGFDLNISDVNTPYNKDMTLEINYIGRKSEARVSNSNYLLFTNTNEAPPSFIILGDELTRNNEPLYSPSLESGAMITRWFLTNNTCQAVISASTALNAGTPIQGNEVVARGCFIKAYTVGSVTLNCEMSNARGTKQLVTRVLTVV